MNEPINNPGAIREVLIEDLVPNRFQPRILFEEEGINELATSIKEHGIIQPLVVRQQGEKFEIIAGERRYKASQLAGLTKVPVVVREMSDNESAEVALIENVQRRNLNSIELARSYKTILDMGQLTQEQLAKKMGKTQSAIANTLRLLNLSAPVQEALMNKNISERHARSLLSLKTPLEQKNMLARIIDERLTVRKTDEIIKKMVNPEAIAEVKTPNVVIPNPITFETKVPQVEEVAVEEKSDIPSFLSNIEALLNNNNEEKIDLEKETLNMNSSSNIQTSEFPTISNPIVDNMNIQKEVPTEKLEVANDKILTEFPNFINPFKKEEVQTEQPLSDFGAAFIPSQTEETPVSIVNDEVKLNIPVIPYVDEVQELQLPNLEPVIPNTSNVADKTEELLLDEVILPNLEPTPVVVAPIEAIAAPELKINEAPTTIIAPSDIRLAINTIRECVKTLEKHGFNVDSEELDFENKYSVTIEILK